MDFSRLRGLPYFEQKGFIEKASLKATKALDKTIKDGAKKEQEAQAAPITVPGEMVLAQMPNVARPAQVTTQKEGQDQLNKGKKHLQQYDIEPVRQFFDKRGIEYDESKIQTWGDLSKNYGKILKTEINQFREVYGIKTKEKVFNIQQYFNSDNIKKTETTTTYFEYSDLTEEKQNKIKEEQISRIDESMPANLQKKKNILKPILEKLFENGIKSQDYSFYKVPLTKDIISKTFDIIEEKKGNIGFNLAYKMAVIQHQEEHFEELGIKKEEKKDENGNVEGYLIRIPKTSSNDKLYEERVSVIQTHSCSNWCVHQKNAYPYIQNGDFVIYKPKTDTLTNIGTLGFSYHDNSIVEIENSRNDRKIQPEDIGYYESICNTFPKLKQDFSKNISDEYQIAFKKHKTYEEIINKPDSYKYISLEDLIDINKHFKEDISKKDTLRNYNIAYLNALKTNENITDKFDVYKIQTLNTMFKENKDKDIQDTIKEINIAYLNAFKTSESITDKLDVYKIETLNTIFKENKDKDIQNTIKEINVAYLNAFKTSESITDKLDVNKIETLNTMFKENDDKDIQNTIKEISIAYLNAFKNMQDIASKVDIYQLSSLNNFFKDCKDDAISKAIIDFNIAYLRGDKEVLFDIFDDTIQQETLEILVEKINVP